MICLCARKIWWEHAMAVVVPRSTIEMALSICSYGKVSMTASTLSWVKLLLLLFYLLLLYNKLRE